VCFDESKLAGKPACHKMADLPLYIGNQAK
jgi:hypothetical protein